DRKGVIRVAVGLEVGQFANAAAASRKTVGVLGGLKSLAVTRSTTSWKGKESMFKEFREFAMKGNVLDLAVGIIIGAAFGKIITSFVNDVLMPPVGLLL